MKNEPASVIAGIGSYLPEQVVTNSDVDEKLNGLKYLNVGKMLENITGVKERRYSPVGMQASDLAVLAAKKALRNSGYNPSDLDTILYTSCSRDLGEPATASIIQSKLGAINAKRVMDVTNACSSFYSGLEIMNSFISTGITKVGLVLSGEKLSTVVNWNLKTPSDLKTGFAALTLGDGGGAFVLTENTKKENRGIVASHFFSDGREWKLSVVMGGGTISPRNFEDTYFKCDSLRLNRLALKHIPDVVEQVLNIAGYTRKDLDLVIPHQVSYSIIEKIAKRINCPMDKVMVTLDRLGNIGAASIPIALDIATQEGRAGKGSRVLLAGGAAGFSAGAVLLIL